MHSIIALCLVLAGVSLVFWARKSAPKALPLIGGPIAIIVCFTLSECCFRSDLGIDQTRFRSRVTTQISDTGRIAPISAGCLALAGLALLFLGLRAARHWRPLALGSIASVIISLGVVTMLGYAFAIFTLTLVINDLLTKQ
jgi:hypothetical protein